MQQYIGKIPNSYEMFISMLTMLPICFPFVWTDVHFFSCLLLLFYVILHLAEDGKKNPQTSYFSQKKKKTVLDASKQEKSSCVTHL